MNTEQERAELLPCPFCGGEPSITKQMGESLWSHDIVLWTQIQCDGCEAHVGPTCEGFEVEAVDIWNRRAALQSQKPKGNDIMLSGVIRMPFEMAMADPISRMQFYQRAQQALNELESLQHSCKETSQDRTAWINVLERKAEALWTAEGEDRHEAMKDLLHHARTGVQSQDREDALDKAKHALMIAQAHTPCPLYAEAIEAIDHARRVEEEGNKYS